MDGIQYPPTLTIVENVKDMSNTPNPNIWRVERTFLEPKRVPNSVVGVSGQFTVQDIITIDNTNDNLTFVWAPIIADTPSANMPELPVTGTTVIETNSVWPDATPAEYSSQPDVYVCNMASHPLNNQAMTNSYSNASTLNDFAVNQQSFYANYGQVHNANKYSTVSVLLQENCVAFLATYPGWNPSTGLTNLVITIGGTAQKFVPFMDFTQDAQINPTVLNSFGWAPFWNPGQTNAWTHYDSTINAHVGIAFYSPRSDPPVDYSMVYGQCWYSTYCNGFYATEAFDIYNPTVIPYRSDACFWPQPFTDLGQFPANATALTIVVDEKAILPTANAQPYREYMSPANHILDHQISYVRSIAGVFDYVPDNGPFYFLINNTSASGWNSSVTSADPYIPMCGHTWIPLLIDTTWNGCPFTPIPCWQATENAPRMNDSWNRVLSYQTEFGCIGAWRLGPDTEPPLHMFQQARYRTWEFPKNLTCTLGKQELQFFPPRPPGTNMSQIVTYTDSTTLDSGANSNCICPPSNLGVLPHPYVGPMPSGLGIESKFVYSGRYAFVMEPATAQPIQAKEEGLDYTSLKTYKTTILLAHGTYSTAELVLHISEKMGGQSGSEGPFWKRLSYDPETPYMLAATEYSHEVGKLGFLPADTTNVFAERTIGTPRGFHFFAGKACDVLVGSPNFGMTLTSDGRAQFQNAFYLYTPTDVLATSTFADGQINTWWLGTSYSRAPWDPPVVGGFGFKLNLDYTTIDQEWYQQTSFLGCAFNVDQLMSVQATSYNSMNCISLGLSLGSTNQCLPQWQNYFGQACTLRPVAYGSSYSAQAYLQANANNGTDNDVNYRSAYYSNVTPVSDNAGAPTGNMAYQVIPGGLGTFAWLNFVSANVRDTYEAILTRKMNGRFYFNPWGNGYLPGPTGLALISVGDGTKVQTNLLTVLGFNPTQMAALWTPKVEIVHPLEGVFPTPPRPVGAIGVEGPYSISASAVMISNQLPHYPRIIDAWADRGNVTKRAGAKHTISVGGATNAVTTSAGALQNVMTAKTQFHNFRTTEQFTSVIGGPSAADFPWIPLFEQILADAATGTRFYNATLNPIVVCASSLAYTIDVQLETWAALLAGYSGSGLSSAISGYRLRDFDWVADNPYLQHCCVPQIQGYNTNDFLTLSKLRSAMMLVGTPLPPISYSLAYTQDPMLPSCFGQLCNSKWAADTTQPFLYHLEKRPACTRITPGSMMVQSFNTSAQFQDSYIELKIPAFAVGPLGTKILPTSTITSINFSFDRSQSFSSLLGILQSKLICVPNHYVPTEYPALHSNTNTKAEMVALIPSIVSTGTFSESAYYDALNTVIYNDDGFDAATGTISYTFCKSFKWLYIANLWQTPGPVNTSAPDLQQKYCNILNNFNNRVPMAGRIVCSCITPVFVNQAPLIPQYGYMGQATKWELLKNPKARKLVNAYSVTRSRQIGLVTNYSLIAPTSMAPIFSVANAIGAGPDANLPIRNNCTVQQFQDPPSLDASDPLGGTNLVTDAVFAAALPTPLASLANSGLILLRITGFNFATDCNTIVNGVSSFKVIPCTITTGAQALQTIAFNSALDFEIEAQTLYSLTYELYDLDFRPLTALQNVRFIVTLTPTDGPTAAQAAFMSQTSVVSEQNSEKVTPVSSGQSTFFESEGKATTSAAKRPKMAEASGTTFSKPGVAPRLKATYFQ